MEPQQFWFEAIKTFGLPTVLLIVACYYLGKFVDRVMKQNELREAKLTDLIQKDIFGLHKVVEDNGKRNDAAIVSITEAQKYQRQEHDLMMDNQKEHASILRQIANKLNTTLTV